jgi:hypothetical protein
LSSLKAPQAGFTPLLFICAAIIDGVGFIRRGVLVGLQLVQRQRADLRRAHIWVCEHFKINNGRANHVWQSVYLDQEQ